VRRQEKAYVLPDKAVQNKIMKICHNKPTAGHFGHKKTLKLVQRKYYWPNMATDVSGYIDKCDVCQKTKARHS
jgi:hypothetical protein